ncbi:MAG: hypothetical protein ABJD53_14585 [Gammaproteobacteria bacterium]
MQFTLVGHGAVSMAANTIEALFLSTGPARIVRPVGSNKHPDTGAILRQCEKLVANLAEFLRHRIAFELVAKWRLHINTANVVAFDGLNTVFLRAHHLVADALYRSAVFGYGIPIEY